MIIEDEDFKRIFGTDSPMIEPAPKATKATLARHQHEAELIKTKPEMFDATKQKPRTTLFE